MSPLLPLAGLGLLLLLGKKSGASVAAFTAAVQRMRSRDAVGVLSISRDTAFDKGTQQALFEQAQRMGARLKGAVVGPMPTFPGVAGVDIDNSEFATRVMALEGNPVTLAAWAKAYKPVYPTIGDALMLKAVQISVAMAVASRDPKVLRKTAASLREQGFPAQAAQLEAEAARLEAVPLPTPAVPGAIPVTIPGVGTVAIPSPVIGPQSLPNGGIVTVLPPTIPVVPQAPPPAPGLPAPVDPKKARALNLAVMLANAKRYKEDQNMVRLYQQDNGLTADGKYGCATALSLATRFGIIPPRPYYFSKKTAKTDKEKYKSALAQIAMNDPDQSDARQQAWLDAMKVDNL